VALDGFVVQEDDSQGRRLFAFVRSFFVAENEAKALAACLAKQHLGGRWLPEKPECHYTYAGEVPWCDTFPKTDAVDLRFVVEERRVKVRRKRSTFFLDGKQIDPAMINLARLGIFMPPKDVENGQAPLTKNDLARVARRDRVIEVEEVRQEFRKFKALIPVHDIGWEGRNVDNVQVHGITLAKQLAQSAGLVHLPGTHDLQTKEGVRATYGIAFRAQDYHNNERFFFIREDILRTLLRKHKLCLVWAVWGERELSYKYLERAQAAGDRPDFTRANFQAVYHFKHSRFRE
jgi:hypothetical protein